jgi:hypothetical protein
MRAIIYNALVSDPVLSAVMADRWTTARGVDAELDQAAGFERPFGTFRIVNTTPGVSRTFLRSLEVWIHDDAGSYARIDPLIRRVKDLLTSLEQIYHVETDSWLQQCSWVADSPDLFDDARRTNTRMASFQLVGSGE